MNSKAKKILLSLFILIGLVVVSSSKMIVTATETLPSPEESFINTLNENYSKYILIDNYGNEDYPYAINNSTGAVSIALGLVNNELSISIYYLAKVNGSYIDIKIGDVSNERVAPDGYASVYKIPYNNLNDYEINLWVSNDSSTEQYGSYHIDSFETLEQFAAEHSGQIVRTGEGKNNFPDTNSFAKKFNFIEFFLNIIMVVGIFIIGILAIIIAFVIVKKKTNIKRDSFVYYDRKFSNNYQDNNSPNQENTYVEATYDEETAEVVNNLPENETSDDQKQLTPEEQLRDLYQKRFRGLITEEELNEGLRKFKTYRDDD